MKSDVCGKWQRHRTTATERSAWVLRFERSGLSSAEFARRHGLGRFTLQRWRNQRTKKLPTMPPLREVSLAQPFGQPQWIAEVRRPDGLTLRLSAAALPWLERLLAPRPC